MPPVDTFSDFLLLIFVYFLNVIITSFYMVFEVKNLFEGIDYDFYIQIFLLVDSLNLKTIFTKDTIFIGISQFFFLDFYISKIL